MTDINQMQSREEVFLISTLTLLTKMTNINLKSFRNITNRNKYIITLDVVYEYLY